MGAFLRKYATGTGSNIAIPMVKAGSSDYATSSDWTPATGDVKVSIDGGSQANITTLPTYTNGDWVFTFSNAELTGKRISVRIVDSATKAVEDSGFNIETFGNASAMHLIDYTDSTRFGLTALPAVAFGRVNGISSSILADSTTNSSGIFSATSTQYAFTALSLPAASLVSGGVKGCLFVIKGGTGFGQSPRVITNATYSTGVVVLTFATAWTTTPDSSTTWEIWHTRMPSLDASLRPSVLDSNGANFDATATSASPEDIAASIRAIIPTTVGNPFIATKDLAAIPAASAHPIQWTVLNNGAVVDLTGKTVRCVFALVTDAGAVDDRTDDTLAAAFQYQTGGDGIVISGTSNNIVTLTHSVTKTATPGAYKYWLWNITDNVVLARGKAPIEAAAKSA